MLWQIRVRTGREHAILLPHPAPQATLPVRVGLIAQAEFAVSDLLQPQLQSHLPPPLPPHVGKLLPVRTAMVEDHCLLTPELCILFGLQIHWCGILNLHPFSLDPTQYLQVLTYPPLQVVFISVLIMKIK
jgi:hypothetical protein